MIKKIFHIAILVIFFTITANANSFAVGWNKEPVAEKYDGYARVVFEWFEPVPFQAQIKNSELIINFERELVFPLNNVVEKLPGYFISARKSNDNKKAVFRLRRDFILRSFVDGKKIVIDLLGNPANVEKNIKPIDLEVEESGNLAKSAPSNQVNVRTGRHNNFQRFVFDWDYDVQYFVTQGDDTTIVNFYTSTPINLNNIRKKLPKYLKPINYQFKDNKGVVTIPSKRIKNFKTKNKIVVDVEIPNKPTSYNIAKNKKDNKKDKKPPVPKSAPVSKVKKTQLVSLEAPKVEPPKSQTKKKKLEKTKKQNKNEKKQEEKKDVTQEELKPKGDIPSRIVSLSFPWKRATNMAVFRRHGYLWIVFDRKENIDFDRLVKSGEDVVLDIKQLPHRKATVLRLLTVPYFNPSVRREGLLWIVDLMLQPQKPIKKISVIPKERAKGEMELFLPVRNSGKMISVVDSNVGDVMYVIPLFDVGRGIHPQRDFVDLKMPITAQGVAIVPKHSGIYVKTSNAGAEILSPGTNGLQISPNLSQYSVVSKNKNPDPKKRLFDIERWVKTRGKESNKDLYQLLDNIKQANENDLKWDRLELARYYAANGYPAEALGILRTIKVSNPDLAKKGVFFAARGLANYLFHRYEQAVKDLSHPDLVDDFESNLFRSAATAELMAPQKQVETLLKGAPLMRGYPRQIRTKLSTSGVKSALAAGKDMAGQNFLEIMYDPKNTPNQKASFAYYKAKWHELIGDYKKAYQEYENAINLDSRKYNALAKRDFFSLQKKIGKLKKQEYYEKLEDLLMSWREEDFEYNIINKLADAYKDAFEYGKAMRLLKDGIIIYRNTEKADIFEKKLNDIFSDLYLEGGADKLRPIKSLGLYNEFRSLTPKGEKGNEILKKLADRLVGVDLIGEASKLLEEILKTRKPTQKDRSNIGTRLALLKLINKKPKSAIRTLNDTSNKNATDKIKKQRKYIRVRALSELNRPRQAIDLIKDDMTEQGLLLKAEIFWKQKKWGQAADILRMLIEKPKKGKKLSDEQAQRVIDWATALQLAGRKNVLVLLRKNFLPYMEGTSYYDAFNLLTSDSDNVSTYGDISKQIKEAEEFRSFMSNYVNRIKDETNTDQPTTTNNNVQ